MTQLNLPFHKKGKIDPSQRPAPLLLCPTSHGTLTQDMFSCGKKKKEKKYIAMQRGN